MVKIQSLAIKTRQPFFTDSGFVIGPVKIIDTETSLLCLYTKPTVYR